MLGKSFRVKITKYIRGQLESNHGFGDLERTFYALLGLSFLGEMNSFGRILKKKISEFIFRFRAPIGGFSSLHNWNPDTWSTFFAIAGLKLLGHQLNEDECKQTLRFIMENQKADGLFSHCNNKDCLCGAHSSYKSTFFAVASLYLLDQMDLLDTKRMSRILLKRMEKSSIDRYYLLLTYRLLNPHEVIDDELVLSFISSFQGSDGGFGKKADESNITDTFFVTSVFSGYQLIRKLNKGKVIKFLSEKFKPDGGFNQNPTEARSDLIQTAQADAIMFLLLPSLIDEVEDGLLQHVHVQKEVYVRTLCDEFFVTEKLVLRLVREMQAKYKWFSVDIVKYKELFNTYLSHLPSDDQRIAKKTLDYILNKRMMKIDLTDFAKTFRRIPDKQVRVKKVISKLIEQHFIIGSIEESKKRLRKTQVLRVYILPDNIIVRKKEFPYNTIVEEKQDLVRFEALIDQYITLLPMIIQEFQESIKILLEADEVELARGNLDKHYDQALVKLAEQEKTINSFKERFFLIDIKRSLESLKEWKKNFSESKKELQNVRNDLDGLIKDREKIIKAYNELEKLVEFINDNTDRFNNQIETLLSDFQRSCAKHELGTKRDIFLGRSNEIEENVRKVAQEINNKITELYKITNKGSLLKNVILTDDSSLAKGIITLNQDLEDKSRAFDEFLATQWRQKQSTAARRLEDMRSKIYKRDEILKLMDQRKASFHDRLENIKKIEDNEELNLAILRALDFITETNLFLDEYIHDTGKILDDFEIVAGDIPFLWTDLMDQMRIELEDVKKETEEKIMTLKEKSKKSEFDALVDSKIKKLNRALDQLEDLSRLEVITPEKNLCHLLKERYSYLKSEMKKENRAIFDFLNQESQEFKNFTEITMVPVNRWKTYEKFMESSLRNKKDHLIDTVLQKLILEKSNEARGGRIKIQELATLIGLSRSSVKKRLEQMILSARISAEFVNADEIIPLTVPNLKQLEFEKTIEKYLKEQEFERLKNLFLNYCESYLLDDNKEEIKTKTKEILANIEENDGFLKRNYPKQLKNPYNSGLIQKWTQRKSQIKNEVALITKILDYRRKFDNLIKGALLEINAQLEDINEKILKQIDSFHNLDEVRSYLQEIYGSHDEKINMHEEKLRNFIQEAEDDLNIKKFLRIIADLQGKFNEEIATIKYDIKQQRERFEQKFVGILEEELKIELKKKIERHKDDFYNLINEIELEQANLLENGNLDEAQATLKATYKNLLNVLKNMDGDIKSHISNAEKNLKIPNFRDSCIVILREWNINELEDVLKRTKILLEDEIIKKNLIYMEKVYETPRIPIQQLANRMGMKRSTLKSRLFRILGTSNMDNIKIDSNTNEIVFGMGRISYQEMRKVLNKDDLEMIDGGELGDAEKSLLQVIYNRLKSVVGFVSVFISLITALHGVSSILYNATGNFLFFSILWIGYPVIVGIVIFAIFFYYWIYPKKIKKKKKPFELLD